MQQVNSPWLPSIHSSGSPSLKREERLVVIRCFQELHISTWLVPTFTPLLPYLGILRICFSLYLFTDLQVHTFLTICPAILVCQLCLFHQSPACYHKTLVLKSSWLCSSSDNNSTDPSPSQYNIITVRITLTEPQNKSGGQSRHRQCHTGAKW